MATLQEQFETAAKDVQGLPQRPSDQTLLKLYALYKQATAGDVKGARPGFTDFVGRAKFDAWAALAGQGADEAMQGYIDLVESLK